MSKKFANIDHRAFYKCFGREALDAVLSLPEPSTEALGDQEIARLRFADPLGAMTYWVIGYCAEYQRPYLYGSRRGLEGFSEFAIPSMSSLTTEVIPLVWDRHFVPATLRECVPQHVQDARPFPWH